eukprot:scaffold493955_cov43-Prasinocladus_malaysianus.AAC.1
MRPYISQPLPGPSSQASFVNTQHDDRLLSSSTRALYIGPQNGSMPPVLDIRPATNAGTSNTRKFQDFYAVGRVIESGEYSTVRLCSHRQTGAAFTVRITPVSDRAEKDTAVSEGIYITKRSVVEDELTMYSSLKGCDGVLELREAFADCDEANSGRGNIYS